MVQYLLKGLYALNRVLNGHDEFNPFLSSRNVYIMEPIYTLGVLKAWFCYTKVMFVHKIFHNRNWKHIVLPLSVGVTYMTYTILKRGSKNPS